MKLVHSDLENQIIINPKKTCQWVIESPIYFSKYLQELNSQINGKEGNFVLSDNQKEYDISKYVEIVINPFDIDINSKKILNRLYMELSQLAYQENSYLLTQEILAKLQTYFLELEQESDYILGIDENIDISGVWKALGVKFENYAENLLENISQYIKIMAELMKKKLIVFVNLGSYLRKEELEQLIELAMYNEIALLFIENIEKDFPKEVSRYIIDNDRCEIF